MCLCMKVLRTKLFFCSVLWEQATPTLCLPLRIVKMLKIETVTAWKIITGWESVTALIAVSEGLMAVFSEEQADAVGSYRLEEIYF